MDCQYCAEPIKRRRPDQKFCSNDCRYKYHSAHRKKLVETAGMVEVSEKLSEYSAMLGDLVVFLEKNRAIIEKLKDQDE